MFDAISVLFCTLFALSTVTARVVPRSQPPKGWATNDLESYDSYHCRYQALSCNTKHNTDFFTDCCHPLLAGQNIKSRPAECQLPEDVICSGGNPTTSFSAVPTGSSSDDECGDDTSSGYSTSTHSAPPSSTSPPPKTSSHAAQTSSGSSSGGSSDSSGTTYTGGFATWFTQNGVAGACGTVHQDTDLIVALDQNMYGNSGGKSQYCGKSVEIYNESTPGRSVQAIVADDCPTCTNSESLDLSEQAFKDLAGDLSIGEVKISWKFLN
ncbi:plant expansin [Hygrophoropsis aurantiaca]|uniref:Plant expansin n=1 Tax=Hygrophoropsis aurantiaca TaxID=72124 RepID=A0ACB8ALA4_9AGAM|nr:plant expansin [Hygrophoropsis aurantiaca]